MYSSCVWLLLAVVLISVNAEDAKVNLTDVNDFSRAKNDSTNAIDFFSSSGGTIIGPVAFICLVGCIIYFCLRHSKHSQNGYRREELSDKDNDRSNDNHFPRRRYRFFRNNWRNKRNQRMPPHQIHQTLPPAQTNVIIQPIISPPLSPESQLHPPSHLQNSLNVHVNNPPQACAESYNTSSMGRGNLPFNPQMHPPPPPPYYGKY